MVRDPMALALAVDPALPTPPYEQIKNQIIEQRSSGELPANHRLPPVRQLAVDLGVAPNTVARAYRELEADGVLQTRGRLGTFVAGTEASARREGAAAARDYLGRIRTLGLPESDAAHLLDEVRGEVIDPAARC